MSAGGPGAPAAPAVATERTFRIVISYRRVDTGGDARSLCEALERRFGGDNVFLDIETIGPGEPFDQAIDRAVASSDVLLALVGQHWLTITDEDGRRRIDDPGDVVRMEVRSALQQGLLVIPVLLEDAKMPPEEELPPDIAAFSKRNAVELRATKWKTDVESFVDDLAAVRREKLRRLGVRGGWLSDAAYRVRRAAAGNPRAAALAALVLGLVVAALVAVLALGGGGDDGGGGNENGNGALHPPLAADETLAFVSGGRLMLLDGDAPEPAVLPGGGFRTGPDLTADGSRVAYSRGGNLWAADRDGANETQLTRDAAGDRSPAFSDDGSLVAFDRPEADDPERRGIWVVPADGSGEATDLQAGAGEVGAAPDWSPDGRSIAYQRGTRIWIMAADGSGQRELVPNFDRRSLFAAWAPNGQRVAFLLADAQPCELAVVRAAGTDLTILRPGLERCGEPTWSPDGRYLAVPDDEGAIWAVPRDGREPERIVAADQARSPAWARRG